MNDVLKARVLVILSLQAVIIFFCMLLWVPKVSAAFADMPNNLAADGRDLDEVPLGSSPLIHLSSQPNDADGYGGDLPRIHVKLYTQKSSALTTSDRTIRLDLIGRSDANGNPMPCNYSIRADYQALDGSWASLGSKSGGAQCSPLTWENIPWSSWDTAVGNGAFHGRTAGGGIKFATLRFVLTTDNTIADIRQVVSSGSSKLGFMGGEIVPIDANASDAIINQYDREITYQVRFGVPGSDYLCSTSPFTRHIFWRDDDFTMNPEKWPPSTSDQSGYDGDGNNMRARTFNKNNPSGRVGSVDGLRPLNDSSADGFSGPNYGKLGKMYVQLNAGQDYSTEFTKVNRGNTIGVQFPYDSAEYYIDDECPAPPPTGDGACDVIGFNVGNNGNSTVGDRRYKVWVNDGGSPGTPSGGEDFNGLAREDNGPAGYTLDNANVRINLRDHNKIVSGNLQFTIRVHDTSSATSPVIFEQTYNIGPCYRAECSVTIHNQLPAGGAVIAGNRFPVTVKVENIGINPIPATLNTNSGSYPLSATLIVDGKWHPPPDNVWWSADGNYWTGYARTQISSAIYQRGNPEGYPTEATRRFELFAPNDINTHSLRMYPDFWGRGALGDICNGGVNTYKRYDFSAQAGTSFRQDSESPDQAIFDTWLIQDSSPGKTSVNSKSTREYYKNDSLIAGFPPNPRIEIGSFESRHYVDEHAILPGTYSVGDRFCVRITLDHGHGWRGPNESYLENTPETASDCPGVRVTNHPYIRAYGADVVAGGGFGDSCGNSDSRILTFMRPISEQNGTSNRSGSGVQLAAMALGEIRGFTSASTRNNAPTLPTGLTFANNVSPSGNPLSPRLGGGMQGDGWCMPDYFTVTQYPDSNTEMKDRVNTGSVDISNLANNKQTFVTPTGSTVTINNSAASYTGRRTVYIDGDAFINSNIRYNTDYSGGVDTIPSFTLVVKGNIYISNNVTQIDGLYIAQPRDGNKGRIFTCANSSGAITSPAGLWNDCGASNFSRQLVVNGSFVAQRVVLNRTAFTLRDSRHKECVPGLVTGCPDSKAAEVFNFSPEMYLRPPLFSPRSTATSGDYQYLSILPPVL